MLSRVYRASLILHITPQEAMTLSHEEFEGVMQEYIDMKTEELTGKRRPKIYESDRAALKNLREHYDGR